MPLRTQFERRKDDDENGVTGKQEEEVLEGGQAAKTKAKLTKMGPGGSPKEAQMEIKSRNMLTRRVGEPKRWPTVRIYIALEPFSRTPFGIQN